MTDLFTEARPTNNGGLTMTMHEPVPSILIVDDHEDTRALLRYVFESHRYEVTEAADGAEAVRLAEAILPNLILMDTRLSKMTGVEATRCIRGNGHNRNVPIVFLSGQAQPQSRLLALAAGADEYLVKPVSLEELEKVIERLLSGGRQTGHAAQSQEECEPGNLARGDRIAGTVNAITV